MVQSPPCLSEFNSLCYPGNAISHTISHTFGQKSRTPSQHWTLNSRWIQGPINSKCQFNAEVRECVKRGWVKGSLIKILSLTILCLSCLSHPVCQPKECVLSEMLICCLGQVWMWTRLFRRCLPCLSLQLNQTFPSPSFQNSMYNIPEKLFLYCLLP